MKSSPVITALYLVYLCSHSFAVGKSFSSLVNYSASNPIRVPKNSHDWLHWSNSTMDGSGRKLSSFSASIFSFASLQRLYHEERAYTQHTMAANNHEDQESSVMKSTEPSNHSLYFSIDYSLQMMHRAEVDLIASYLRPTDVYLEYGSGGSTMNFAPLVRLSLHVTT